MNAIVVRLQDLPGLENIDVTKMSAAEVEVAVRQCFAFFPKSGNIRVAGEIVTIELPEAAVADAAEAARLPKSDRPVTILVMPELANSNQIRTLPTPSHSNRLS